MPRRQTPARYRPLPSNRALTAIAASGGALALLAAANQFMAWRAEGHNPPIGGFLKADGIRLHYADKGSGPPLVLIHGAGALMQDFSLSVLHHLTRGHRVIVLDRPGYGYSERPADRRWTPEEQARVIRAAIRQLGIEKPVIVGHSFGASVALSYAARFGAEIRGVVLVSGYYFPTFRPAMSAFGTLATPVIGALSRYTIAPVISRIAMPGFLRKLFAPNPVPSVFLDNFPFELAHRPEQIRAAADDFSELRPWTRRMRGSYGAIGVPTAILAGMVDQIVDTNRQSTQLHRAMPHAIFRAIPGVGHMLHHAQPDLVLEVIAGFDQTTKERDTQEAVPARA